MPISYGFHWTNLLFQLTIYPAATPGAPFNNMG